MKTTHYYVERYRGIAAGVIISAVCFLYITPVYNCKWEFILVKSFDFGMGTFGFLLAILALIVQGGSDSIKRIKERKTLYNRFVFYNKKVVFLAITISFYSMFAKLLNDFYPGVFVLHQIDLSIYLFLVTWFLVDTFGFLKLFYIIVKE